MVDLFTTVLTLSVALMFTKYMAYYIVYFFAKLVKFLSKGKIDMKVYTVTFGDILSTAILCLILSIIFKIAGII